MTAYELQQQGERKAMRQWNFRGHTAARYAAHQAQVEDELIEDQHVADQVQENLERQLAAIALAPLSRSALAMQRYS